MLKKRHYGGIVELKKDLRYIKTYNNLADINLTLSVITLNGTDQNCTMSHEITQNVACSVFITVVFMTFKKKL